jgi:hypothetical protein
MTPKRLRQIWQKIAAAKRGRPSLSDLEDLARLCGRRPYAGGKHVMWVNADFPGRHFPIPRHGGDPTASFTVRDAVLEHLELDAAAWEERLGLSGGSVGVDGDDDDDTG